METMGTVDPYIRELCHIRSPGGTGKEPPYFLLAIPLGKLGETIKPKVFCIVGLKQQGASASDSQLLLVIKVICLFSLLFVLFVGEGWAQENFSSRVPSLIKALKDSDPMVRWQAALALGEIGSEARAAVPALIEALNDNDIIVSETASRALMKIRPQKAGLAELIKALKSREPIIRGSSALLLGFIEPEGKVAIPALIEALKDKNWNVRSAAAQAIGEIGPAAKAAARALGKAMDDRNWRVRVSAAESLWRIGIQTEGAVTVLIDAVRNPNQNVRLGATRALTSFGAGAKAAIPALIETLKDENQYVRTSAAEALGAIGPQASAAVATLIKLFKDDNDIRVREAAAEALGSIRSEAGILVLIQAVGDPILRGIIVGALGKAGQDGRVAIPALIEVLKDQSQDVRTSAAEALAAIARALEDAKVTDAIDDLKAAHRSLMANSDPEVVWYAETVRRSIEFLELVREELLKEAMLQWIRRHANIIMGIALYSLLSFLCLGLLWIRPLWLLQLNDALKPYTDFKLPDLLGGMKLPIQYLLMIGFFHYNRRVLDAWVAKHVDSVREGFQELDTVRDRKVHIAVPVLLDGENVPELTAKDLRQTFGKKRGCLLIWGEGGAGKTSVACQVARWAMSDNKAERLCEHVMLPVLIEQELDFEVAKGRQLFTEAIRGQLQALIGQAVPISEELHERLLTHRRVLVIVDHLSEMSDETRKKIRPSLADFPAHALVVTSRIEEKLGGVPKSTVKPLRIQGNRLSSFMEAYLTQRGQRDLFDDGEFFDACKRLSLMVGERDTTVLLAKLYAEQMITYKEDPPGGELPDNIPDLILSYLNELNRGAREVEPDDRTVHRTAKAIAWECLRHTYRPTSARLENVLVALSQEGDAHALIKYLEDRLRLIQTVGASKERIRFALDPLAEYLAGLYLVDQYGEDGESWHGFLAQANKVGGGPETIKEFLLAMRDCCLAKGAEAKVPEFVVEEIGKLAALDPEGVRRAQLRHRMGRLIEALDTTEPVDRFLILEVIKRIGPEARSAVPALIRALKDPNPFVRANAACVLGAIGGEAKAAVPDIIELLKNPSPVIRTSAASALGAIGPEAGSAVPALTKLLQDEEPFMRGSAAHALVRIGVKDEETLAVLDEAKQTTQQLLRELLERALKGMAGKEDRMD